MEAHCFNCKFFKPFPLTISDQGDCVRNGEFHNANDGCASWETRKADAGGAKKNSTERTLEILKMELNCYERQNDYTCCLGDARCVKCDYNIRQGTISEHMEALKEAIKVIEEGEKK